VYCVDVTCVDSNRTMYRGQNLRGTSVSIDVFCISNLFYTNPNFQTKWWKSGAPYTRERVTLYVSVSVSRSTSLSRDIATRQLRLTHITAPHPPPRPPPRPPPPSRSSPRTSAPPSPGTASSPATAPTPRGLHPFAFQLNISAFCGIGGASRGCLGGCSGADDRV